ncbi:RAP domain-containing protein, chloroplastic-like [Selaginella moellendorffii]|uniref:RAP domain-containing protein, chloroplastic-like n=1 Tax=Selaginella moellendorffii TaxID=88036 RepID=UPI000D1CF483|nr:RAP domain-containing protein, chloroplastic-like [Selaginella moellendorffii]|eukprot:XP_024533092.1 RAP domain-containing protein, chloroplastic-like [Selaginella moellendorffii]
MELLHSSALCVARFHRCSGGRSQDFGFFQQRQRSQVRQFPWLAANAAAPSRPAPVKPDFFDNDDSEEDEEDQRQRRKAGELDWATRARELAIQDMSFRNFTDEDFQALLPPHLRISKKKAKKKKKTRAKQEGAEAALQLEESRSAIKTKKKKDKDDDASSLQAANDTTPVDPKKLKALAKRFNAHRERYMNIEQSYSDSEGDEGEEELTTELTVVYGERREEGGGEESDDGEELPAALKDPRLLEIRLNQDLVDSRDVEEVLETIERVKGRFRLSSINVATALHRIAKHMVTLSMSETRRLKYARQCDVAELVASAMELLPECNAQGVSNIAWAISKIGGHLLYRGEMEIIARAALAKVDEFNPQNIANVAGAFASMQHSSPALFEKLMDAASRVPKEFRAQELAQLLWSFACMAQPLDSFLDSLDAALQQEQGSLELGEEQFQEESFPGKLSIEQLSSIAWSYAVLGQLQRPFFAHVCKEILAFEQDASLGQHKHMLQLTQLYQVVLALKWEGNHLELALGDRIEKLAAGAWEKERSSRKSTSFLQKDIERFLVCTGRQWIPEYVDADYSLDFAMKGGKVAIEVNGPSHFARNTGDLLGHTVLKHRLLEAAGWKIISASYAEWENLQGESEHVDFIQKLVAPHIRQIEQANERAV